MLNYLKFLNSKQRFYLLIGVIMMIGLYSGLADFDWYWQCELGKAIVQDFNFNGIYDLQWGTLGISEYLDHEWLTNIMFYLLSLTGEYAVSVTKLLICAAYAWGTYFYLETFDRRFNDVSKIGICAYVFIMATVFVKVKAYALSAVFLMVEVALLRKYKEKSDRRYFIYMFVLLLLWNNMHSGSIPLFFVVAGVYWLTELKRAKQVLYMLPVYVAGLVINPWGYKLIVFDIEHNFDPVMKQIVMDWRPIDAKETLGKLCAVLVLFVIFFALNVNIKRHAFDLVMLGVVFFLGFQSARQLIYLAPFFYAILLDNEYQLDIGDTARWFSSCFFIGIAVLSMMQGFGSTNYKASYMMDYMDEELKTALVETNSANNEGFFDFDCQVWSLGLKSFVSGAFPCTRERQLDGYEMCAAASDTRIEEIIEKYCLTKFLATKYNPAIEYLEDRTPLFDYLSSHDEYELVYDSDFYYYFVRKDLL